MGTKGTQKKWSKPEGMDERDSLGRKNQWEELPRFTFYLTLTLKLRDKNHNIYFFVVWSPWTILVFLFLFTEATSFIGISSNCLGEKAFWTKVLPVLGSSPSSRVTRAQPDASSRGHLALLLFLYYNLFWLVFPISRQDPETGLVVFFYLCGEKRKGTQEHQVES